MLKSILIVLFSNIFILLIYSQFQTTIEFNSGKGFDGQYYYEVTEQIQSNEKIKSHAPFAFRIGTPLIVSLFFDDIKLGFIIINIIFSILLSIIIYLLSNLFLNNYISIILAIIYQLHWISGIRYILFDPIGTDYIALFFVYLGLYALLKEIKHETLIIIFISLIGSIFREIALIPLILLIIKKYKNNEFSKEYISSNKSEFYIQLLLPLPFLIYLLPQFLSSFGYFIEITNDYDGIKAIIKWFYIKGIGQFLHSVYNVIGLFLVIPILFFSTFKKIIKSNELIFYFILIILTLALIGGSDTERFISWGLPIFSIIISKIILEEKFYKNGIFYFILVSSILTFRIFWITPSGFYSGENFLPILTFISNDFHFSELFAMHGNKVFITVSLFQYLFLSFVIYISYKYQQKVKNGNERNL